MAATLIGKRYILHEELGKGGMGVVFRATDRLTGSIIALKQVSTPTHDPMKTWLGEGDGTIGNEFRMALAQEFQMLSSLRHPNIISVLDYGFDEHRQPYFAMDYLENAQTLLQAAVGQSDVVKTDLLAQTLQAIAYLHRRGILHRDLKPANVLVKDGQVKVLDFGLATARGEKGASDNPAAGTLAYMSPEVLNGEPSGIASDLYAVGMMAYEMFSGRYPYNDRDIQQLLHDIIHLIPDVQQLDLDESLQQILQRLIAKPLTERYKSAAEVLTEINQVVINGKHTLSIDQDAIRESFLQAAQFVGRETEFEQISAALSSTIIGKGSAWLTGGESGVGKTRLLDELRTMGLVKGAFVLRGQNVSDGGRPYEMWRDILRRLTLQTELSDEDCAVLKPLVPDIAHLLEREIGDPAELDTKAAQERLITVIINMFRSQSYPLLLILEDLHWVSSESITVLQQLITALKDTALMIVASYRDDERPTLPQELSDMEVMKLQRLSRDGIAKLTESMMGEAGRRTRVVEFVERETEGNVFFMVEVVRALAEETGEMEQIGLHTMPQKVVAGGIQKVIRRRLNQVPDEAWNLLNAAAVAGRELDLEVLRALISSREIEFSYNSLEQWLITCAEIAVLAVQHERWRFAHDKLREGLLSEMPEDQKQALHRQVALAIENVYPGDKSRAAVLAHHWGNAGDTDKTAHYAAIAGVQSMRAGAGAQAHDFFEQAIKALAELPDTEENMRMLIDVTINLSHVVLFFVNPEFPMILGRALQAAESLQDEALLARIYGAAGTFHYTRGHMGEGLGFFSRSMALAEKLGIEELLLLPYNYIGRAVMVTGDLLRAEKMLKRGISLAEKFNDAEVLAGSLSWYAYSVALQGRLWEVKEPLDRAFELAQQAHEVGRALVTYMVRGTIYYHCGLLDEAKEDLLRAKEMAEDLQGDIQIINILGTLGCVEVLRGEIAEATEHLDRSMLLAQRNNAGIGLPDFMVRRAEIELLNGKPQEALALAQTALALAESTKQSGIKSVVMRVLGKIYANMPQPDLDKAEALLKASIENSEPGNVQTFIAVSRLELAKIYATNGRDEEAHPLLIEALSIFERGGMTHYLQQTRAMLGSV